MPSNTHGAETTLATLGTIPSSLETHFHTRVKTKAARKQKQFVDVKVFFSGFKSAWRALVCTLVTEIEQQAN